MITEKPAWLKMAEAYSTDFKERTEWQHQLTWSACCIAIHYFWIEQHISWTTKLSMNEKIADCLTKNQVYFYPGRCHYGFTDRYDALRADFCYSMYYSCGDDNNERI